MKNYIKYSIAFLFIVTSMLFTSCGDEKTDEHGHEESEHSEEGGHGEEGGHEEGIHLTKVQIAAIGLEFGELSVIKANDFIKVTGTLGLPPSSFSAVAAKAEGIVKGHNRYIEGNYIKKGEVIAYLENPSFIVKQQDYLEAKAQLKLNKLDLERQETLVKANAGVARNLQNAQAKVEILEAKVMGLAKQLNYLGIGVKNLKPTTIHQQIKIIAPMNGYISNINLHNGMYALPSVSLMQIIADDHLHLELNVFEKDISVVKIGQKISYTVPALGNTIYEGEVSVIGKEFNPKNKSIRIHGHLEGKKPQFLKDLFLNAKIWLSNSSQNGVQESSVIRDDADSFVYVATPTSKDDEIKFEKIMVIPGATTNGFTAVKLLNEIPKGMKIVTKGAYYVYAQSKAGELAHEH